jgi:prepilin-type processing-associated H-X9-DG protein
MNMYLGEHAGVFPKSDYGESHWPVHLMPYIGSTAVLRCPNEPDPIPFEVEDIWVSYGYNYRYLAEDYGAYWAIPRPPTPVNIIQITRPESVVLMADSILWWSVEDGTGRGYYLLQEDEWATPHPRHRGRANVLWVDGHVTAVKWDIKDKYAVLERRNWDWNLP